MFTKISVKFGKNGLVFGRFGTDLCKEIRALQHFLNLKDYLIEASKMPSNISTSFRFSFQKFAISVISIELCAEVFFPPEFRFLLKNVKVSLNFGILVNSSEVLQHSDEF